jgi:hypothetical protein
MIDVLEEAARRSNPFEEPFLWREYGQAELPIVRDLIEEGMVRGETRPAEGGFQKIGLESITLKDRQLRDDLIEQRKARSFRARLTRWALVALGWIGGLISPLVVEYVKTKITQPH